MAEADIMPIEAMGDVHFRAGDRLRAGRERMGLSRAELSLRTKINERHLAAVEDSDFAALPARIYAVGFARSFAAAVGLDGTEIAAEVRRELNERDSPANERPAYDLDLDDPAKVPSRRLAWLAAAAALVLIVAGAVFFRSYFVPAVDLPPVREDAIAQIDTPELNPAASVSPTAESAAGEASPLDQAGAEAAVPVKAAAPAAHPSARPQPAARQSAPAAAASSAPAQGLPSPVPERLEPLSEGAPVAPANPPVN